MPFDHVRVVIAALAALLIAVAGAPAPRAVTQQTPAVPRQAPIPASTPPSTPPAAIDPSAPATRPSDEVLASISREGRRIASYHEAIAKARQRIAEAKPDLLDQGRLFVVERAGSWHVLLVGREMDGTDARGWLLRADALFSPKQGEVSRLDLAEPPRPAPADAQATMRALDTALQAAQGHAREYRPPYDEAIFRVPGKPPGFVVYLQGRSGARGFARPGADMKGGVTADGTRLTEFGPLHGPGEAIDVPPGEGTTPTLHTHATVDLPTATDVAAVIDQPGVAPHLVLTPHWMFRITADGVITWLGPNAVPPPDTRRRVVTRRLAALPALLLLLATAAACGTPAEPDPVFERIRSTADDPEAARAVAALLSAYGGADTWASMRGVEYHYRLTLFGPDAAPRPAATQVHRLSLDPGLWLEMQETFPGDTAPRVTTIDGEMLHLTLAGVASDAPDDADFRRAVGVTVRWEFRLPWTLLDRDAIASSRPQRTPATAGPVPAGPCDVVRLRFDAAAPGSSTDDWHDLYISRRSHLVEQVHTYRAAPNDYRLTVWSEHRDFGGIRVATKRRTYASDVSAAIGALQAEAEYSDIRFDTLPPEGAPE